MRTNEFNAVHCVVNRDTEVARQRVMIIGCIARSTRKANDALIVQRIGVCHSDNRRVCITRCARTGPNHGWWRRPRVWRRCCIRWGSFGKQSE